jgi:hypothetical protein
LAPSAAPKSAISSGPNGILSSPLIALSISGRANELAACWVFASAA